MIASLITTCIRLVCGRCRAEIEPGQDYVIFDRAGVTCRWCVRCFKTEYPK